jgi:HEAT repeat protein
MVGIFRDIGPSTVPALAQALRDSRNEREYWRRCALRALTEMKEEALASLLDLSEDEYLCVRLAAIRAVGLMGPQAKAAIPVLTRALKDPSHYVQNAAARALESIQSEQLP